MDFKINQKRATALSIPYARTHDDVSVQSFKKNKPNYCFFTLLFTISLFACAILFMIYVAVQTDGYLGTKEPLEEKEDPIESGIPFLDTDAKDVLLALANEDADSWAKFDSSVKSIRFKRQLPPNIPRDCRAKQEECRIILDAVRGITKSVHQKLDGLQNNLVKLGILKESDSKDAKFRKIFDCLQCRNAINQPQRDENSRIENLFPQGFGRQNNINDHNDRISDLLPFLENHVYSDDDSENEVSDERSERVPKTPGKQILESVTNTSKLASGAVITEILHNTTIVERDDDDERRRINSAVAREESQVTRNVDATPIILPTAETTKTSQQIQFTPQSSWPSIPVCFYGPPSSSGSSSNSYQFKQTPVPPFFPPPQQQQPMSPAIPYGQGMMNQPVKFFYPNGQPAPPQFVPNFPQMPPASSQPQFMNQMMMPGGQRGGNQPMPFYCTYMPMPPSPGGVPNNQQQQFAFPQANFGEFQRHFTAKSRDEQPGEQIQTMTKESKSTYDASDEKYQVTECAGFWCSPPYKKCIANHERCDGKVDCMGADDEIDCPYIGYYSRFQPENIQQKSQDSKQSSIEDVSGEMKVTNYAIVVPPTVVPVQVVPEVTDNTVDLETTTFKIELPVLPPQFTCKRIIQTVSLDKRCNNVYDCEDTSDEEDCTCKDYLKLEKPHSICDGHVDCLDGSDEQDCGFCKEDQYHCHRSGGCIPKHKRCDQNMDCKLNEDELDCFALTDGQRVNLDMDKRPHLNLEGVLTRYDNGIWRASCFKPEYRNLTKRMGAGQKICEYLGFKNVDSVDEVVVKTSRLTEKQTTFDHPIDYEYPPHLSISKRESNSSNTCYGLKIRCKPILDRKVNVHLNIDPKTNERNYLWPWEASVFVDGKYHCSAVLLENDLLLSSTECSKGIDLHKNYTTATLGVSSPDFPFASPYQQTSQVVDIKPLRHSDASLFRLRDDINMTRYVQPLYLEKRIFPAAEEDTCVAIGVNDRRERIMQFLQPIVDNCPKCHRCYSEKSDAKSTCSRSNETVNWSGNVVCLSNGGWYPAAVFQDKDQHCGFSNKQILNSIDYIHAHLSQAIDEKVQLFDEPKCEGIRCSLGECIPWDRVCDGVKECRDGSDESPQHCQKMRERCDNEVLECKCSKSELRCGNGKCVPKEMFCDGKVDCADGSDEPYTCSCAEYLKLTEPKRVCDGRRHCLDKSDENYQDCLCKDSSFKCHKSLHNGTVACIPQDFVCDGETDCPYGEDEAEDVCWAIKAEKLDPKGKGEVMRRDFGVLHSECFPRPIKTQREVTNVCNKLGYTSGLIVDSTKMSDSQYVARNDFYMFQLNNYTWVSMREDTSFGLWVKPQSTCYRLFVHCFK